MIRPAVSDDVPAIVAMGLRFQASSPYAKHLRATADTLERLARVLVASPSARIWLADRDGQVVGMLAAALYAHPMSGELVGTEIAWWVEPEARGGREALRLLKTAEQWAKEAGATIFQMMAPGPEVCTFYERLGFEPIELHYMRRIA